MNPLDLVEEIRKDEEAINRHWTDPEMLSAIILRLSIKSSTLGELVTESENAMDRAESFYKHKIDTRTLDLRTETDSETGKKYAVGVAEVLARVEVEEDKETYLERKRVYQTLKRKREDLEKVIDAARSRLSLIKGDIQRTPGVGGL